MIIDKEVEITIGSTNMKHYKELGYNCKNGSKLIINTEHLQRGTGIKINVKCDVCGKENNIYVQKYFMNIDNMNFYTCKNCSDIKRKITNRNRYGIDNVSQSDIVKQKKIETTLKNWGVENPSQSIEIKKIKVETMLENYGVEYVFQSKDLRNNIKKTCLNKYGDRNYHNVEKSKQTNLEKYGYENVSQNEIIYLKKQKSLFFRKKFETFTYQGSYELDFLEKYYKIVKKHDCIKYQFEGKDKIYFPDFYYEPLNMIIEIKSTYTYKKELDINLAKQKACLEQGYKFIFILDKNYDEFNSIIS